MSNAQDQGEPSMEEILASIRKIISEDDAPAVDAAREETEEPEAKALAVGDDQQDDEEILELTQAVGADGKVVNLRGRQGGSDAAAETGDAGQGGAGEAKGKAAGPEGLVSPSAETAAVAALSSMAKAVSKGRAEEATAKPDGLTMEGLVRDALEPHLKAWLDAHLSDIVERVVREEIRRLARRAEDP